MKLTWALISWVVYALELSAVAFLYRSIVAFVLHKVFKTAHVNRNSEIAGTKRPKANFLILNVSASFILIIGQTQKITKLTNNLIIASNSDLVSSLNSMQHSVYCNQQISFAQAYLFMHVLPSLFGYLACLTS